MAVTNPLATVLMIYEDQHPPSEMYHDVAVFRISLHAYRTQAFMMRGYAADFLLLGPGVTDDRLRESPESYGNLMAYMRFHEGESRPMPDPAGDQIRLLVLYRDQHPPSESFHGLTIRRMSLAAYTLGHGYELRGEGYSAVFAESGIMIADIHRPTDSHRALKNTMLTHRAPLVMLSALTPVVSDADPLPPPTVPYHVYPSGAPILKTGDRGQDWGRV